MNYFGNWPKKTFTLYEVILGGQQKCLQSSQNNATYHPMNADTVTYKAVDIFGSGKCFICFISDVPCYI